MSVQDESHIPEADAERTVAPNFLTQVVDDDLRQGRVRQVVTRFPPEPNGYLHIGHAKAICLDFGLADDYRGHTNLRFDDTNPATENPEYVEAIKRDVRWLGFAWDEECYASDYFDPLYRLAQQLVEQGNAYVDSLSEAEIRDMRGTVFEPGRPSPYRDRPAEESLDLLERMRRGEFAEGAHVLRARVDMTSPNMCMRDPLLYRIRHAHHYRTGDAWHIYPMYDFAHPLSDAIEGVTHSLCSLEFENNREVYDWLVARLFPEPRPRQYEFARLNVDFTVTSKRKLMRLVNEGHVDGWDDPRMPTLAGLRRRGVPPAAIRDFVNRVGVTRANSRTDFGLLEASIRDALNTTAPRLLAVTDPVPLTLTNVPDGYETWLEASYWPHDVPREGARPLPFSERLWIEREDYHDDPPRDWRRFAPGAHVRLRHGPVVVCDEARRDDDGALVELRGRVLEDSVARNPEGVSVRGVVHWLSQRHALPATLRLYDRLFRESDPEAEGADFTDGLFERSLVVREGFVEPALRDHAVDTRVQFERTGYFWRDPIDGEQALVLNRIVTLKDAWGKRRGRTEGSRTAAERPDSPGRSRRPAGRAGTEPDPVDALDRAGHERFDRLQERGLDRDDAARLALDPGTAAFFEAAAAGAASARLVANWMVNELPREARGRGLDELALTPGALADLVGLVEADTISAPVAKDLLAELVERGGDPRTLVRERGLEKVDDDAELRATLRELIEANPDKAAAYRGGKSGLSGFFIGGVMRATGGRADPKAVGRLLDEELPTA